jgi:hypothetical protein
MIIRSCMFAETSIACSVQSVSNFHIWNLVTVQIMDTLQRISLNVFAKIQNTELFKRFKK